MFRKLACLSRHLWSITTPRPRQPCLILEKFGFRGLRFKAPPPPLLPQGIGFMVIYRVMGIYIIVTVTINAAATTTATVSASVSTPKLMVRLTVSV